MKILELFAGSQSFSRVAIAKGHKAFTTDSEAFDGIDYVADVLDFDYARVPFVPDIIWASPPCTGFSVASIGTHWGGGHRVYQPLTDTAKLGIELVKKTLEIIDHYKKLNPELIWYIENPRGVLRKLGLIDGIRHTVTYCQYGEERMKPTDIWTNNENWTPRPMCKNGDKCHTPAPRGSKTGTQGRKNAFERSRVPDQLCQELLAQLASEDTAIKQLSKRGEI